MYTALTMKEMAAIGVVSTPAAPLFVVRLVLWDGTTVLSDACTAMKRSHRSVAQKALDHMAAKYDVEKVREGAGGPIKIEVVKLEADTGSTPEPVNGTNGASHCNQLGAGEHQPTNGGPCQPMSTNGSGGLGSQ